MTCVRFFLLTIFCLLIAGGHNADAQDKAYDADTFGSWPVLYDGRLKTMDSFARSVFYDIAKTDSVDGVDATQWMANTLFDPSWSITKNFIKAPAKKGALDLPDRAGNRYSMNEVMRALEPYHDVIIALEQRNPATYSAGQKDLMALYQAVTLYNQIIQSFSAVLPLIGDDKTFREGGGSQAQRFLIAQGGEVNRLLRFIPNPDHPHQTHLSLWEAYATNPDHPLIPSLEAMARAWNEDDAVTWNKTATQVREILYESTSDVRPLSLRLENLYTKIDPFLWAMGLYGLMAILSLFARTHHYVFWAGLMGGLFHAIGLGARIYILDRPPTGTLYETLIFGAFIVASVGLFLGFRHKAHIFFMVGTGIIAAFLLFISRGFVEGDSLNVLAAVLNTNFWLSTHVTCIIIGYAFCLMVALGGHIVLWNNSQTVRNLLVPLSLSALLFTAVGTLLGGIWADQSWGRFWGWDPKENGALLIVLWLIWVLHGRISKHFTDKGFYAALSLTTVMVAITWFGVNLLGVGLHSYGFISGIAWSLGGFIVVQSLIVGALYYRYKKYHDT